MNALASVVQQQAREAAFTMPLESIDPANPDYFVEDTVGHYFARLRRDDPVHRIGEPDLRAVLVDHAATRTSWPWTPTTRCSRRTGRTAASR